MRRNMRKVISVVLLIAMFITSTLVAFPAMTVGAATVPAVDPNASAGIDFKSGIENVYTATSKLAVIPRTIEATITVDASPDDQWAGIIFAAMGKYDTEAAADVPTAGIMIDYRKNVGEGYGYALRIWVGHSTKTGTKSSELYFKNALVSASGTPAHIALTIDPDNSTVNLYVNGELFESKTAQTSFFTVYNAITPDMLDCHTIGGDYRRSLGYDATYAAWRVDNYRYLRGNIHTLALYSDVRTLDDSVHENADTTKETKTGILSHIPTLNDEGKYVSAMPPAENGLMAWYEASDLTEYGEIPDKSGNGYKLTKGVGRVQVSKFHVPADFDGDGYTDKYDWNGDGILGDDEYAKPIGTLAELLAIEDHTKPASTSAHYKNIGKDGVYGKGGIYYLTANITIPPTTKTSQSVLYHGASTRFTETIKLDGCGYTIDYDTKNRQRKESGNVLREPVNTAIALFGHGTYDVDEPADLYIWNLNVTGIIYAKNADGSDASGGSNIAAIMRTGTSGETYFKNLVVDTDIVVGKNETYVSINGKKTLHYTGANRSVAGIIAKNVGGDVTFEDVTYFGKIDMYDDLHDYGGQDLGSEAAGTFHYEYPIYVYETENGKTKTDANGLPIVKVENGVAVTKEQSYGGGGAASPTGGVEFTGALAAFMGHMDGKSADITFKNCMNLGTVVAHGTVGDNTDMTLNRSGACVAGFLGKTYRSSGNIIFDGCTNRGEIVALNTANNSPLLAGFVGYMYGINVTIANSQNLGTIRGVSGAVGNAPGSGAAGGFIGKNTGATLTLENCKNEGVIATTGEIHTGGMLGLGLWANITLDGCYNSGTITHYSLLVSGSSDPAYVGGLVGAVDLDDWDAEDLTIKNSGNSGDVLLSHRDTGASYVVDAQLGGILGAANATAHLEINNCTNSGDVTYPAGTSGSGWGGAGGIVGTIQHNRPSDYVEPKEDGSDGSAKALKHAWYITSCVNTGNITGGSSAGGILSGVKDFATDSTASSGKIGELYLKIQGCKNFGDILTTHATVRTGYGTGGIVGDLSSQGGKSFRYHFTFDILDCYNVGNVTTNGEYVGGIVGAFIYWRDQYPNKVLHCSIKRCVNAGAILLIPVTRADKKTKDDGSTYYVRETTASSRCGDSWGGFAGGIIAYVGLITNTAGDKVMVEMEIADCINIGTVKFSRYRGNFDETTGIETPVANENNGYLGYGTFPIVNCAENRAAWRHENAADPKASLLLEENPNNPEYYAASGNNAYFVPHINGGTESTGGKSHGRTYDDPENGNIFFANSMVDRQAAKSHTGWSCKHCSLDGTTTEADPNCWHEFSNSADANGVVAKLQSDVYSKNDYYSNSDIGLLRLMVTNGAQKDVFLELMEILSKSYTYEEENYTTETWATFFRARANAAYPLRYTGRIEDIRQVINKLEAAINNLSSPDYTALINAINSTHISDERMHNYEVMSRKAFQNAVESATSMLTARTQSDINKAAQLLIAAYNDLEYTSPAYIIVIPEELAAGSEYDVSVITSEFNDYSSLDVKIRYDGVMNNAATAQDTVTYDINAAGSKVDSESTKILNFPMGAAENTTKETTIVATNLGYSNTLENNSQYVSGLYKDEITFVVNLQNQVPKTN